MTTSSNQPHNPIFASLISIGKVKPVQELISRCVMHSNIPVSIIGNSPTLNNLGGKELSAICGSMTIGFNAIPLHSFIVPDLWIFEVNDYWTTDTGQAVFAAAKKRMDRTGQMILVKDTFWQGKEGCRAVIDFISSLEKADVYFITKDHNIASNNFEQVQQQYLKLFAQDIRPDYLIRKRGSLAMAMFLCLIAEFKRINIIACELANSSYFHGVESQELHYTERAAYGLPMSKLLTAMVMAFQSAKGWQPSIKSNGGRLVDCGLAELI